MTKPIAERFDEWMSWCSFNSNTENAVDLIRSWLRKQPENKQYQWQDLINLFEAYKFKDSMGLDSEMEHYNSGLSFAQRKLREFIEESNTSKTFTLEEVEVIAREAVAEFRYSDDYEDNVLFDEVWWANKKKELSK